MGIERDIDHLIKLVASVAEAFTAALFLPSEAGDTLSLAACHSLSPHIRHDCTIEVGSGLVGWVAANGEPVAVSDFKPETTTLGFYGVDEEIKSFLAVPVPVGDKRGVLAIDSKRSYVFPPRMQKLMTLFADHVGGCLHNSAVQALMVQNTSAIDHLSGVCDQLIQARSPTAVIDVAVACPLELVGADGVAVALVDEGGDTCRVVRCAGESMPTCRDLPVSLKQSLAGWVIRNAKALALTECREYYSKTFVFSAEEPYLGVQAFLGVPLVAGSEVLGVLAFLAKRKGAFREAEVSTARLLASQISAALRAATSQRREWLLTYREPNTGLPNFRYLRRHGREMIERATSDGQRVVCLALSVRELDALRLEVGRAAVGEALRGVAAHLRSLTGEKDLLGRDEEGRFILLCYRVSPVHGRALADELQVELERMTFNGPAGPFSIKAAVGLAIFPDEATGLDALMGQAARNATTKRAGGDGEWQLVADQEELDGSA